MAEILVVKCEVYCIPYFGSEQEGRWSRLLHRRLKASVGSLYSPTRRQLDKSLPTSG